MARFLKITGGSRVKGEIEISGSKNATLALMAAAILCETPVRLKGVPWIQDIYMMMGVLRKAGGEAWRDGDDLVIGFTERPPEAVTYEVSKELRASILVMGGLLGRYRQAVVSRPGGCELGHRPVDLHIAGMEALGATVEEDHGDFVCRAEKGLKGTRVVLRSPSVGATENLIIAATRARGTTEIINAAQEPEVRELIRFLRACGARIEGEGTRNIRIEGVANGLQGCEYEVIKDRIEGATFVALGAACGGELLLKGAPAEDMTAVMEAARQAGVEIEATEKGVYVRMQGRPRPLNLETGTYPGFPTDAQPPFVAVLARATGQSIVTDRIFENRFNYVGEMNRMGAKIKVQGGIAIIEGQERMEGADVEARDLRGGAALVVAGASAEGCSRVFGIHHIERGYENLVEKLRSAGVEAGMQDGEAPDFV